VGEVGLDAGKETSLVEEGDDMREWEGNQKGRLGGSEVRVEKCGWPREDMREA